MSEHDGSLSLPKVGQDLSPYPNPNPDPRPNPNPNPNPDPDPNPNPNLLEQANEISATLHALGLAHVPVHVVTRQVS